MIGIGDLDDIEDPLELYRLATQAIIEHKAELDRFSAVRASTAALLHAQGRTYRELGELAGITPARVGQIIKGRKKSD